MSAPSDEEAAQRAAWLTWKTATFGDGYLIWHEGLDVAAVTRLQGPARADALTLLRRGLALDDEHAAQALSAMHDHASAPAMRALLARSHGAVRVCLALALHLMRSEPALAHHLIAVLHETREAPLWHGSAGINAAIGLRHFRGRADEAALFTAVGDPAYLIRYHACNSLLHRWGIARADVDAYPEIFTRVRPPDQATPDAAAELSYAQARELLRAIKARRRRR